MAANNGSYTVASGDTMWAIAQKNHMSLKDLEAANPQIKNPNLIFPGQQLSLGGDTVILSGSTADGGASTPAPEVFGTRPVVSVSDNPTGKTIPEPVTSTSGGVVSVSDNPIGKSFPQSPPATGGAVSVADNPTGKSFSVGASNPSGTVNVSDNPTGKTIPEPVTSTSGGVVSVSDNPIGKSFPTTSSYNTTNSSPSVNVSNNPIGKSLPKGWGAGASTPSDPANNVFQGTPEKGHPNTNPVKHSRKNITGGGDITITY